MRVSRFGPVQKRRKVGQHVQRFLQCSGMKISKGYIYVYCTCESQQLQVVWGEQRKPSVDKGLRVTFTKQTTIRFCAFYTKVILLLSFTFTFYFFNYK